MPELEGTVAREVVRKQAVHTVEEVVRKLLVVEELHIAVEERHIAVGEVAHKLLVEEVLHIAVEEPAHMLVVHIAEGEVVRKLPAAEEVLHIAVEEADRTLVAHIVEAGEHHNPVE